MLILSGAAKTRRLFHPPSIPRSPTQFGVWIRPSTQESRKRYFNLLDKCIAEDSCIADEGRKNTVELVTLRAYLDGWENIEIAKRDDQGKLVMEPVLDDSGEPVLDKDGHAEMQVATEPVAFERDEDGNATRETVEKLPDWIRWEIYVHLNERDVLTEKDRKNSV